MTLRSLTLAGVGALALAACATDGGYQAAPDRDAVGYSEQRIEDDRYRVRYRAPAGEPASVAQDFALLRAAEIAVQRGYDWFQVVDRFTDTERESPSGPRIGVGVGTGGRIGGGGFGGVSVGTNTGGSVREQAVATLEVIMGKGDERPEGDDVYDARAVFQSLRPGA